MNVYRDQWINSSRTQGKEVCDLLVVFGNRVIIFSDKYCEFPESGDLDKDWRRWYRRTIAQSFDQLKGAERWIRQHPDRLFSDRACKVRFPLPIPDISEAKFHRVIVAHGAAIRCMTELGGSGSLMLRYQGKHSGSGVSQHDVPDPFTIQEIGNGGQVIHVFDDNTVGLILGKLDTISDFVAYLDQKERLLSSGMSIAVAGEEDLLAYYLWNMNDEQEHDFVFDHPADAVFIEEGTWEQFSSSEQRREQIKADRVSYLWDALIKLFIHDSNELPRIGDWDINSRSNERVLRLLATETRFRRRMLGKLLHNLITEERPNIDRFARVVVSPRAGDPYYVFLGLRQPSWSDRDEYRSVRLALLDAYCKTVKLQYPNAGDIVGISTDLGQGAHHSFDALYVDSMSLSRREIEEAEETRRSLKLLNNVRERHTSELEYPEPVDFEKRISKGRYRNAACPCGSGLKYKHCCNRKRGDHSVQQTRAAVDCR